jgi:uncharacterized protein YigE (DUF2233 family)
MAPAEPCRDESFNGVSYVVCSFDPARVHLRTYWRGGDGKPYRTFAALAAELKAKGDTLRFAINGGMYGDDFRPVGLYIENGRELTSANTAHSLGHQARYRISTKSRMACSISVSARQAS